MKLGYKNLTLGFYDGKSFNPLDFTLQAIGVVTDHQWFEDIDAFGHCFSGISISGTEISPVENL